MWLDLVRFDVINNCMYGARIIGYIYNQILNFKSSDDDLIKILFPCEICVVWFDLMD